MAGTTTKFTPERAAAIVDFMVNGAGMGRAAGMAGITRQTIHNWRKAGIAAGRGAKWDFHTRVAEIEAADIGRAEQTVKRIMRSPGDDKTALNAATWFLERRAPDEYGRRDKIEIEVKQKLVGELLDYLRERVDRLTYDTVLAALVPDGSGGADALAIEPG